MFCVTSYSIPIVKKTTKQKNLTKLLIVIFIFSVKFGLQRANVSLHLHQTAPFSLWVELKNIPEDLYRSSRGTLPISDSVFLFQGRGRLRGKRHRTTVEGYAPEYLQAG